MEKESLFKKIDRQDVFILLGLVLLGIGLFFWFGLGPALAVPGAIITFLGVLSNTSNDPTGLN